MGKKLKNNPAAAPGEAAGERLKFRGFDMPLNTVVFLAIVTLALYMGTLRAPFVFDDIHAIVNNPYITSLKNVPGFFLTSPTEATTKIEHSGWRPLWYLSFAMNYRYAGLNPSAYHATNVFIHFLNAALVYFIALRLFRSRSNKPWLAALLAALFFAAHPLQTETVSYVVSRSASMATFFYLLAFYAYDVYRDRGWKLFIAVAALSFCLSALTKEIAVTLPVMIIIYDFSLKDKTGRPVMGFAILLSLTAVYMGLRFYFLSGMLERVIPRSLLLTWMTEAYVVPRYIFKVFIPTGLNIDPDVTDVKSLADPRFYLSLAALVLIFYGIYRMYKVNRFAGFFSLWFFIALITETVMPIADFMAEHRTYLPLAGPALLFGYFLERLTTHVPARIGRGIPRFIGYAVAVSVLFSFSALTIERSKAYSSEIALWKDTLSKSPDKTRVLMALGVAYWRDGRLDDAEKYLRKALEGAPDNPYPHYNLSLVLKQKKQYDEALRHNLAALDQLPDDEVFLTGLGTLYDEMGILDKAVQALQKAVRLKPDYSMAHEVLGSIYLKEGKWDETVRELKAALELSPHSTSAHNNLGSAYTGMGKHGLARDEYKEALRLNPRDPLSHHNMAVVLNKLGDKQGAVEHYRLYLQYAPLDAPDRKVTEKEIERLGKGK